MELTLLDAAAMRRLNRRATGRRGLTDVLAFPLPQPGGALLGDVYICRAAAERWVKNGALHRLWEACLQRYGQEQGIQWAWQAADGCLVKAPLPPKRAPRRRRSAPTRPIGAKTAANATC